jgi:hypothetical protein
MKNVPFELPQGIEATTMVKTIDEAIRSAGLITTMRNTLRKHPGCVHWNIANSGQPGAIELTYWPKEDRAWITLPDGPRPGWSGEKMSELGDIVRERIGRSFGR